MNKEGICPICNGKGTIPNPKGKKLIPWWLSPLGWLLSKDDTMICQNCDGKGNISLSSLKNV
jgi:hypothetical protein